jgi:hypothetical protein
MLKRPLPFLQKAVPQQVGILVTCHFYLMFPKMPVFWFAGMYKWP